MSSAPPPLVSARKLTQNSQNQAYAKYLARSLDFDTFPVRCRGFPRKFLPRICVLSPSTSPASALVTRPDPPRSGIPNDQPSPAHHLENPQLPKPTQRPLFISEQYWADHKILALASKLSRHPFQHERKTSFSPRVCHFTWVTIFYDAEGCAELTLPSRSGYGICSA